MRDIGSLSPEITRLLFQLGPRKLVIVEGPSDREIFDEWYRDRLSEVLFYASEQYRGHHGAETLLSELEAASSRQSPPFSAILDRDFHDEQEVEAALTDPQSRRYFLRRYCIENYLLEPAAVAEELRVLLASTDASLNSSAIQTALQRICQELCVMVAANWLSWEAETPGASYYAPGHELAPREAVLQKVCKNHLCSAEEADRRLAEKEAELMRLITEGDFHSHFSGKHLLHHLFMNYRPQRLQKEYFVRLLARSVKERVGLHQDIKRIVEERILDA